MLLPALIQIRMDIDGVPGEAESMDGFEAALETGAFYGAQYIQSVWIALTQADGVTDTGEYLRHLRAEGAIRRVRQSGFQGGEDGNDRYELVFDISCDAPHAAIVEYGHGGFHLPDRIQWGATPKVKFTEDGRPYINIPFRHYTPAQAGAGSTNTAKRQMMPIHIHKEAKRLALRIRQNAGHQWHGKPVKKGRYRGRKRLRAVDKYSWQGSSPLRLDRSDPRRWVQGEHSGPRSSLSNPPKEQPGWTTSKYDGMFKTGPKGHESYMTIRTITPDSEGWNIPAQQGRFLAQKTVERIQRQMHYFEEVVLAGIMESLTGEVPE